MKAVIQTKKFYGILAAVLLVLCLAGCGSRQVQYQITVSGTAEESGVISYLGYEMNVYEDEAGNPCGDCAYQPVSFYRGADAAEVAQKLSEAITRADDVWEVVSCEDGVLTVQEKEPGTVQEIPALQSVAGLTLEGTVLQGSVTVQSAQSDGAGEGQDPGKTGASVPGMRDPQRIAAVYGPSYEMLAVLGVEDRIVVRADVQSDDFPWASEVFFRISDVPLLDNVHTSVNFEQLMTYAPDMVYSFPRPNEEKQLEEAGVACLPGEAAETLEDTPHQLMTYAQTLNEDAVERARVYGQYYSDKIQMVQSVTGQMSESEKPKVYYAGMDILTTYGAYSDLPAVIEAAGGVCVSADLEAGSRTQIDYEQLMAWNPDYIFIDHGGINDGETVEQVREELLASDQYQELAAVKDHAVYAVPSGVFYWDMGLQKVLLVMHMAKILHPEEFADLDMVKEVQEFYETFYDYPLTAEQAQKILMREAP